MKKLQIKDVQIVITNNLIVFLNLIPLMNFQIQIKNKNIEKINSIIRLKLIKITMKNKNPILLRSMIFLSFVNHEIIFLKKKFLKKIILNFNHKDYRVYIVYNIRNE